MKTRIYIISIISMVAIAIHAQSFSPANLDNSFKSHQIMKGGAIYQGAVYEPFGTETPVEQSYNPAKAPSGPRKGFGKPDNPGNQSEEYPIGDALCPLLLFAAMFCGIIALRRKRSSLKG